MTDWNDEGTVRSARRSRPPPTERGAAFELRVIEGPDAGAVHAFDPTSTATVFLGRSALCGFRLTEDEAAARHCAIELKDGRLRIVDLSPAKSTRINGVFAHEANLVGGEVIRIGATVIAVRRVDTTPWLANAELRSFGRVLGDSPEMLALFPLFAIVAESSSLLVLEGERGAGKRLLAEEIHARGPRSAGPFVVVTRSEPSSAIAQLTTARGGTLYVEEAALLDGAMRAALTSAEGGIL